MPISTALKNAQKYRSSIYKFAKNNKLKVDWRMTTRAMEKVVNTFKQTKANTIAKTLRAAKMTNDQAALKAINTTTGKFDLPLSRFNRIRKKIVSPADKKLLIHFKDSDGTIVKTYHLQDRLININNLFIDQENQYSSALPIKSYNLLWAYNAGFDCRFLLKHMTFSSKDTNMIDCGTKVKQAHGFYQGREILIKDAMSFLAGGLSELPKMFKEASSNISLEKECFPHNLINEHNFQSEWPIAYLESYKDNQKHHIKHKLADFDAVSLYPSAMSELKGYVKGKAKLFKGEIPSDADYYVARVRFDSIGKNRHFPLLSLTMVVGKQALEDIERFQDAKYRVIEGCYWNEGFNDNICKVIRKMFANRLKYKAEGNPLQNVLKLMMNSSYGKLLMKPIVKKKVFVSGGQKKIDEYTKKNIHKMISRTPISDNLAMFEEHKALSQHFSAVHLGVQILDSSKHIMNRVMCLAEDIDAKIWYQDTDSMHIDYDAVPLLADAYKKKYNKELIGKQMGQFHVDFELEGSKGNIFAKESIFLGKKSYLDMLACDGNDVEGLHIRMKGIPSKLFKDNAYEKYLKLFNGESMSFDLTELCHININSKTQTVSKRSNFTRNVSF
ncbi:TPA: hypothetical protein N0F65_006638 [Lagenidium giganteum]|uniref:DNA-directed DNA polymerase n=1 Tax=Lagenidium giganteum TaxID=4803 RepID=A0AAV2Z625_9STRA|nr:TPA: hypothetical protein N0F65_006638 [Lagenidium giganteum]